jgi:hypothetical protein
MVPLAIPGLFWLTEVAKELVEPGADDGSTYTWPVLAL